MCLVRIPKGPPHLRLALLVLLGNFIIKRVKARARPVTQAYSAAALVSRLSIVDALQDCFHLLATSHLHARPALQASTAQLRARRLPALIALTVLSRRDLRHPLCVPRVQSVLVIL